MAKEEKTGTGNNPTGKGGFQDHPELINRDGAPRKGESLTEGFRQYLEGTDEITVNGVPQQIKRRALFIRTAFHEAVQNRKSWAYRLIMNYVEGMPIQKLNMSGAVFNGNLSDLTPEEEENLERQLAVLFREAPPNAERSDTEG